MISSSLDRILADLEHRMVFQLQRLAARHGNELGGFSGLVIRDEEVVALLDELGGRAEYPMQPPPPLSLVRAEPEPALSAEPADPLWHLQRTFRLSDVELGVVVLAAAVESEGRYARLIAYLNDNAAKTRPSVALCLQLLRPLEILNPEAVACLLPDAPLRRYGLIELAGEGPLADLTPVVPDALWPRLLGRNTPPAMGTLHPVPEGRRATLDDLELEGETREHAEALAVALTQRAAPPSASLGVVGPPGSGREALARAFAFGRGQPVLACGIREWEDATAATRAVREAMWFGAALAVRVDSGDPLPSRPILEALRAFPGLLLTVSEAPPQWLEDVGRTLGAVTLARPSASMRQRLWGRVDPPARPAPEVAARIALRYRLGPEKIDRAARRAQAHAELRGRDPSLQDLDRACRSLCEADFGALAQRLDCPFTREDLVLPDRLWRELDYILAWHAHRGRVFDEWGLGRRLTNVDGLACLLSGAPGTGKTMSAQVLARELELPLYRIDLSQVVNKYIGETEKNLTRVFDTARESHAILFFDEADALFGKRTKTSSAHDRYANIETGYLLQRLEAHEGITLLATNLAANLDSAFRRRFQVSVEFPMPGIPERERLWNRLLPPLELRAEDVDLSQLAATYEFSGGEIRNAALAAGLFAAMDGSCLRQGHATAAARREMWKMGRVVS